MKSFIAALVLVSSSAFADVPATDVFLSVLPAGSYSGAGCSVNVSDLGDKVVITASNSVRSTKKEVLSSSSYHQFRGPNTFFSSDITNTRRGRSENFVRTNLASDSTRYIAVGTIFEADYPNGDRENVVECVINL